NVFTTAAKRSVIYLQTLAGKILKVFQLNSAESLNERSRQRILPDGVTTLLHPHRSIPSPLSLRADAASVPKYRSPKLPFGHKDEEERK
uniref:Uncharacterized protein n=1 Tax=Gasterosteus aculeatus TaxID=69293 RepID=G3PET0_GASAC